MTTGDDGKVELPELPEGWKAPFSQEVSMSDGRFYLRSADGSSLPYDHDHDGNQLVLGGNPEAIDAIEYALNAVYHPTHGLKQQLSDLRQRVRECEERELHRLAEQAVKFQATDTELPEQWAKRLAADLAQFKD